MTQIQNTLDVVVPCYNEEDTIGACLDALLKQSDEFNKIIIVDNNSADKTVSIVKRYQKKHRQILLLHEKRQGVQFARNTGFDRVTADIIGRIDADTQIGEGWARSVREYFSDNPKVGTATANVVYYDLPFQGLVRLYDRIIPAFVAQNFAEGDYLNGSNMGMRRSTWRAIRDKVCMRDGIMDDADLAYHAQLSGTTIGYMHRAKAIASGRRVRTSPPRFWKYYKRWWMTFYNHGDRAKAMRIRGVVWLGNAMQLIIWFVLLFHDPVRMRFSLSYPFSKR